MRKRRAEKRQLSGDPKYGSVVITRFVSCLFRKGKKSVGERIFYNALDLIQQRTVLVAAAMLVAQDVPWIVSGDLFEHTSHQSKRRL